MKDRPDIVLIHGAWADGSCWGGVIERLQAGGYRVTAPQFPLTALADDVARLRQVLGSAGRPCRRGRAFLRRAGHDRPGRGRGGASGGCRRRISSLISPRMSIRSGPG